MPRKEMAKHAAVEITAPLRMRQWCTILERADRIVRPNMVLDTFVGADAPIGPYKVQYMTIVGRVFRK